MGEIFRIWGGGGAAAIWEGGGGGGGKGGGEAWQEITSLTRGDGGREVAVLPWWREAEGGDELYKQASVTSSTDPLHPSLLPFLALLPPSLLEIIHPMRLSLTTTILRAE